MGESNVLCSRLQGYLRALFLEIVGSGIAEEPVKVGPGYLQTARGERLVPVVFANGRLCEHEPVVAQHLHERC